MDAVRHNHAEDTGELLSAYADGAVDSAERVRAEAYIERCPACAQEVGELRALKSMLRELPVVAPVRSFTLDPATAPHPRRLLFPTLRLATLLSAVLLFVVLGVDTLGGAGGAAGTATSAASASIAAEEQQRTMADEAAPAFGTFSESTAAESAADSMAASAAPEQAESLAQASAEASAESAEAAGAASAAASTAATANAPAAAAPQSDAAAESSLAAGASAAAEAAELEAASEAPATLMLAPSDAGYPVPPAGGDGTATESLESAETLSPNTVTAAGEPAGQSSFDTLRIAEVLLALAAVALGLGAWWAWRTGR